MTLESRINRNRYIGNGATTQFPFTFKIWKTDQILVYTGDGTEEQEVSAQCSIEITASGGTVTFATAPSPGTVIVIRRNMPYVQEDDYRNGTRFDSEEIEDRFDQDCAERQDLRLDVDRAVKVPETSNKTSSEFSEEFFQALADAQQAASDAAQAAQDAFDAIDDAQAGIVAVGDTQVERIDAMADMTALTTGLKCAERTWTLESVALAGSVISLPDPLWYVVGRHHVRLSCDGIVFDRTRWEEIGNIDTRSTQFRTLLDLPAGSELTVWITHLKESDSEDSEIAETVAQLQATVATLQDALAELSRNVVYREED